MKTFIVITSINPPTQAVEAFAAMDAHDLVVVGDRKTPGDWTHAGAKYLGVGEQDGMEGRLNDILPFNHYARKMMGYVYAVRNGAEAIVDTDDDNIPKPGWGFPRAEGSFDCVADDLGFVNMYQLYTDMKIWPRGLPLALVNRKMDLAGRLSTRNCRIGVWQGLADEDPDVDAIYRLTDDTPCYFRNRAPVALGAGSISPFNSQNTLFRGEMFPLLYLPACVTFRFTDILRGLVAQPIMWSADFRLGFTDATVVQKRNPHDYMKDFMSEVPMYQHCEQVVDVVSRAISKGRSIAENLHSAYEALAKEAIVPAKEVRTLEAWLLDLAP